MPQVVSEQLGFKNIKHVLNRTELQIVCHGFITKLYSRHKKASNLEAFLFTWRKIGINQLNKLQTNIFSIND